MKSPEMEYNMTRKKELRHQRNLQIDKQAEEITTGRGAAQDKEAQ
jgi:hypothetical protein